MSVIGPDGVRSGDARDDAHAVVELPLEICRSRGEDPE
jgi:hypothetical protein